MLVLTGNANQVGDFKITGDLTCHNLVSTGTAVYNTVNNIATTNAIIEVAQNAGTNQDAAIVFHQANESNAFIEGTSTKRRATRRLVRLRTLGSTSSRSVGARTARPQSRWTSSMTSRPRNQRAPCTVSCTSNSVGVANTHPTETLHVGSNLTVADTGSNVLNVTGNAFFTGTYIKHRLLIGSNVIVDDAATKLAVTGNTSSTILFATDKIAVANSAPVDSISVSDKFRVSATGSNVVTVEGNAVIQSNLISMSNLAVGRQVPNETAHIQEALGSRDTAGADDDAEYGIKSTGQMAIHANDAGAGDSHHRFCSRRVRRPRARQDRRARRRSNTCVAFSTLDAERMRLTSSGTWVWQT